MKISEPLDSQRLSFLLEKAASREAKMWKVYVPKRPSNQDTDISPAQRDEAVRWLTDLHSKLKLYPETLCLAISILDRFLASIKARPKYLRCIAIACFFLAAKTSEEDERIPSLRDLATSSSCGCSPSEILRMERIILDKLNWDLHTATPLDFIHIFHVMLLSCKSPFLVGLLGLSPSQHLALLTQQLLHCMADHSLLQTRGSLLALALLTLELERCCPDWLALSADLLRRAQIDSTQLIHCRELVARCLSTHQVSLPPNTVYIYQPLHQTVASCARGVLPSWHHSPVQEPSAQDSHAWESDPSPTYIPKPGLPQPPSQNPTVVLLSPPKPPPLPPVRLRCKPSAKRKVEDMEVDEFFDGIKRLYNEEAAQDAASVMEGPALGCSSLLSQQGGSHSPCPPLQPVRVP
ncbi:cyclin-I [Denticeps clupeoides]|uniref:Cyclin-I n=1 Tax=Denticeps clupeoides TaxID=299321 RepID=A0AAY4EQ22_9TELE|nr:cyclin-I [Denticeps clupeoides]XP_028830535.1 cyclin-I [Denticeps clupeoides]